MQALLDFIISIVDRLWPWAVVDPWEEGLRVRTVPFMKQRTKKVMPGAVWTWPFFDSVETINVKRQIVDLPNQEIETLDRHSMKVSASLVYKIRHSDRTWLDTQDHDEALQLLAMEAIADYINSHRIEQVTIEKIKAAVFPVVREKAWSWGPEVEKLGITHLTKQRSYTVTTGP